MVLGSADCPGFILVWSGDPVLCISAPTLLLGNFSFLGLKFLAYFISTLGQIQSLTHSNDLSRWSKLWQLCYNLKGKTNPGFKSNIVGISCSLLTLFTDRLYNFDYNSPKTKNQQNILYPFKTCCHLTLTETKMTNLCIVLQSMKESLSTIIPKLSYLIIDQF